MKTKKERILEKYPPKQAGDGGWFVTIRFAPGPNGRKMIKKTKKEVLEEAICEFVGENLQEEVSSGKNHRKDYRYMTAFDSWIKAQQYQNKNTERKNLSNYKRFFVNFEEGRELAERDIRTISAAQIESFMTSITKEFNLPQNRSQEFYSMYFKSVYEQAVRDQLIASNQNPCVYVLPKRFTQFGRKESDKSTEERVVDKDTQKAVCEIIQEDHQKRPSFMAPYACELSILAGMRVGEIPAMTWGNVDFEKRVFSIIQSQKYDEATNKYYISETKNQKKRLFPITDEILDLFNRIRAVQERFGKTGDFVFSNGKRHCNTRSIQNYLWKMSKERLKNCKVTVHAERRTLNSAMASQGVPVHIRATLLGHSPRVNQGNYTYDTVPIEVKNEIVSNVHAGKQVVKW